MVHLELWKDDARAMGIPENMQRGLAFMAGIDLVVNGAPVQKEALPVLAARMSPHFLDPPSHIGGDFNPDPIAALLYDLALKFEPDLEPRIVQMPSGASFPSWNKEPGTRLPPIEPFNLATASEAAKSLYSQIGDSIYETDLEAALISGLKFFGGYHQVDGENTVPICRYALQIRPPHMQWISRIYLFELENLPFWDCTANVFDAFFKEQHAQKQLCRKFYDSLRNLGLTSSPEATDLDEFMTMCLNASEHLLKMPEFAEAVGSCRDLDWTGTPTLYRKERDEARQDLESEIATRWGYTDWTGAAGDLSTGEKCDRICCIVWAAVGAALRALWADNAHV